MKIPSQFPRPAIITIVAAILLLLAAYVPVPQKRVLTFGTDTYNAHYALFGKRTVTEKVQLEGQLTGVGALLVNLHHASHLAPVEITVKNEAGEILAQQTIPENQIIDDSFAWTMWPQRLAQRGSKVIITLTAPQASAPNAIGLRFEEHNKKNYALALQEHVPLWKYLATNFTQNKARLIPITWALLATLVVVTISFLGRWSFLSPVQRKYAKIIVIALLIAISVIARFSFSLGLKGVSGGDPYNYLFITDRISRFENPFDNQKRLPGYPLLILPAWLTNIDDIQYMRFVSVVSAAGILALLPLLARSLKLPWSVGWLAAALLAFQKDFFWTSLRPEPYTLYAFLLLSALTLFFNLRRPWAQVLFGFVLGYAAMTRQEGFVLAAVLGICTLFQWKHLRWQGLARIIAPAFILILPFLIHNTVVYGNPIFTPYFEGERLQIVNSWNAFKDNFAMTWDIVDAFWRPVWDQQYHVEFNDRLVWISFAATLLWWAARTYGKLFARRLPALLTIVAALLLVISTIWLGVHAKVLLNDIITSVGMGVLVGSVIPFLFLTRWRGAVVMLVLISQTMIALWFHPFAKHLQQDYALFILLLAAVIVLPQPRIKKPSPVLPLLAQASTRLALLVPLAIMIAFLSSNTQAFIDKVNRNDALDSVVYRATQLARTLPGPHGFDQAYLPGRLYFLDNAYYFIGDLDTNREQQFQWLKDFGIRTLVVTNLNNTFIPPDPKWKQVGLFKSEGREKVLQSWVYEIETPNPNAQ